MNQKTEPNKNRLAVGGAVLAVIAVIAVGLYLAWSSTAMQTVALKNFGMAPNVKFADIAANQRTLSNFFDRPTVLFFFATWCPSCEIEVANLEETQKEHPGKLYVILVNVDPMQDSIDDVRTFASKHGNVDFTYVFDQEGALVNAFQVSALQTTLVIDESGLIVYRDENITEQRTLTQILDKLLE